MLNRNRLPYSDYAPFFAKSPDLLQHDNSPSSSDSDAEIYHTPTSAVIGTESERLVLDLEDEENQQVHPQADRQAVNVSGGEFVGAHFGSKTTHHRVNLKKSYKNIEKKRVNIQHTVIQHIHQYPSAEVLNNPISDDSNDENLRSSDIEKPTTSSAASKRRKLQEGRVQLSSSIKMFSKQPISENVYKGVKTSKVTGSQWLAIKFLSYKEQKLQEAKILTRLLPHQNVVSIVHSDIYKLGPVDHIYIAMELCHEENLHDHITENKKNNIPFDAQLTISQAKQLVEGLNHIHENGVIHRDLKPNNVLLSLDKKTLKIADFGISKTMTSGRTVTNVTNARAGTDGYRAPETYNSNHISQRADIFSLGLVIYFLWSNGHHVFGDDPDDWNSNIKKNRNRNFGHILVPDKETAVDLLDWILQFQRKQRPRCPEILKHKYFGGTVLSPRPQLVAKSSSALQNTVSKEQTNTGKLNVTPALHRNDGEYSTICNTLQQLLKLQKDPMTRLETLQQIAECQIISKASCIEEINEIVSTCQMLHLSSRDMKSAADKYLDEFNLVRSYIMYVCASEIFRSESEPRIAVEGIERCVWRMSKVIEHMLERPNLRTIPASHIIPSMYEQLAKLRGIEHVSDDAKIKNEAMCLHIIGFSHSQLGEQEKALRIYRDSVELMKQQFGSSAEPLFHDIDETNVHKNKYAEIMKKVPLKDDQENETSGSEKG